MTKIPAVFMRGGTSKGVFFHDDDLPEDIGQRDSVFLEVLGSPDPYGRQLNGLGGGLSSLSKAAVIKKSDRPDADVDYTFAQISVETPVVDYGANCGNLSAAVGPFAVEERLVEIADGDKVVRIFNTNSRKIIHAHFEVRNGLPLERGAYELAGVSGTGAPIALDFMDPAGSATQGFWPTGSVTDLMDIPGCGALTGSLVDVTTPMVFVGATDFGVRGTESAIELEAIPDLLHRMEALRQVAAVRLGLAKTASAVGLINPRVALLGPPSDYQTTDGRMVRAGDYNIAIRMMSVGRIHRAVTLTGAMCLAAAVQVKGSLPQVMSRNCAGPVRIGHPSGVVPVDATVVLEGNSWRVLSTRVFRTARRLMQGHVVLAR